MNSYHEMVTSEMHFLRPLISSPFVKKFCRIEYISTLIFQVKKKSVHEAATNMRLGKG